ncbi:MAG: glycosyl hydrolase [Polyangiaceae bacterium]
MVARYLRICALTALAVLGCAANDDAAPDAGAAGSGGNAGGNAGGSGATSGGNTGFPSGGSSGSSSGGSAGSAGGGAGDAGTDAPDDSALPTGTWLSGAACEGVLDGSFGTWRGRAVEIAGVWADDSDNQRNVWVLQMDYANWSGPIDVANGGIFPNEGESWAKAAAGAYDERWKESLTNIKKARQGKGTTYIRFAHEFNGDWYWPVLSGDAESFKQAWVRFYNLKQSIFPEGKLAWSPNDGTTINLDVRTAYPGSQYVDVIAVDSYNWDPPATDAQEFSSKINKLDSFGAPLGLEAWRKFAESKGVPMAISEWSGVASRGDFPEYMTELHKWIAAHAGSGPGQIAYEILFNCPWSNNDFELHPSTAQPNAADRYRQEW